MPLLDSSFVIDVLAGDPQASKFLRILQQGSAPLGVAPLTYYELYHGVGGSRHRGAEEGRVDAFLSALTVFPLEPAAAKMAGLIQGALHRKGTPIDATDLLIGCTAVHHGQPVVTRNIREFDRIPGLEVLHY